MVYSELEARPLERLERDENKGWILEDGKRILSFRVTTFQAFIDKLMNIAGSQVAQTLLFQTGKEIGQTGLRYSKDKIKSEQDLGKVFDEVLTLRGWGKCLEIQKKSQDSKTLYVFTLSNCPLCHEHKTGLTICHLMGGISAGWLEAYLGKKALTSVERECASTNGQFCVFEITFVD